MAGQYFPEGDNQLRTWMTNFLTKLIAIMTALGLPATFDDALAALNATFGTALDEQEAADTTARRTTKAKQAARKAMIAELRSVVNALGGDKRFTEAMRVELGLPELDTIATPIEPGDEVPTFEVEILGPQRHRVHFWAAGATRGRRGKVAWAGACRIMYAIVAAGAAPPPLAQMQYLASDTATPYDWDIPAEHVGKTVYYRVAWETPTREVGNWSAAVGATVTG